MNKQNAVAFPYHVIRNVVSPEDERAGRRHYAGNAPASSVVLLPDNENVREYLGKPVEGKRSRPTNVNLAIRSTLKDNPDLFSILNGGVVVVARDIEVDDHGRVAHLSEASIINGSQTRGELQRFLDESVDNQIPSVHFEIVVSDDKELVAEISIARNYQNDVRDVSIFGHRGVFEQLESRMQASDQTIKLRKRETDFGDDYLDTEKLVQVLTALAPEEISVPSAQRNGNRSRGESQFRVYAYSQRGRCLKDFADVMLSEKPELEQSKNYFLDVAPAAWKLYRHLKGHAAFSRSPKVKKDKQGRVAPEGVPDGIVFPVVSGLSHFVRAQDGKWNLAIPKDFDLDDFCAQAYFSYTSGPGQHNPQTMGKTAACYQYLHSIVSTYLKYAHS